MDAEYERARVAFQDATIAWNALGADQEECEREVRNTFENLDLDAIEEET